MGWKQLKIIDQVIEERNKIKMTYAKELTKFGFFAQHIDENVKHNVQSAVFRVPNHIDRNALVKFLNQNKIESTLGTYCLSGTNYNKIKYNDVQKNSKKLEAEAITLPCYQGLNTEIVIEKILNFLNKS